MQLAATRIITDDVDALVAFYETATGITAVRLHPMFAELRTTSGTLAIASSATVPLLGDNAAEARANRSITLDFLVNDVDAPQARPFPHWAAEVLAGPHLNREAIEVVRTGRPLRC